MTFEPIAIVGRGALLPGAGSPTEFWENIAAGRSSLSSVPPDRWRMPAELALGTTADTIDRAWTGTGGFVTGGPGAGGGLDPLFSWVQDTGRDALTEGGIDTSGLRAGLVLANLALPTAGMTLYAEQVWRGAAQRPDPRNRFAFGLPAHLAARELGLRAGGFALDAACASSLYAVKIACDRLHDRTADVMLASAVSRADSLILHTGFSALGAISPTGRSRPFHRDADGLVPAEGAVSLALMRLSDAVTAGKEIFGVIRGVGLSNDGSAGGLLAPSQDGQQRAMLAAYAAAGIDPATVTLAECHATGTPVGDATEVASMAAVFAGARSLPIGSAKSNVGHLITAAGLAGLLKVTSAMRAGIRPPTLFADDPLPQFAGSNLRLLQEAEPWTGPRRAAVSGFGFGGTNAHLVLDQWDPGTGAALAPPVPQPAPGPVAIVALGVRAGTIGSAAQFTQVLRDGSIVRTHASSAGVDVQGLRFPPRDLSQTLAQQVLMMEAAREAVRGLRLPRERTAVLVGAGCDAEAARYPARWRAAGWVEVADAETVSRVRDGIAPPMTAAGTLGMLPSIAASRIGVQLDLAGPGYLVAAEEASGIVALTLAARAVAVGEVDAAVVGAVDLAHEPVHTAAAQELGHTGEPGDAAVALVLKRAADAARDGDEIIALLDTAPAAAPGLAIGPGGDFDPASVFGKPHAAQGLLSVAVAAAALHGGFVPRAAAPAAPALGASTASVTCAVLGADTETVHLRAPGSRLTAHPAPLAAHIFSGADRSSVLAELAAGHESDTGPAKLVILAASPEELTGRAAAAQKWLAGSGLRPAGTAFRESPVAGELSFVYTTGSASYHGMGAATMHAFPAQLRAVAASSGDLRALAGWAYESAPPKRPTALQQVWGSAVLAQLHTELSRELLGLRPDAILAYSSGEMTSLTAMGVWRDTSALAADSMRSALYQTEVTGEMRAIQRFWRAHGLPAGRWASYLVQASPAAVRAAIADFPAVHLMVASSPRSCVVGGESVAVEKALSSLRGAELVPVDYDIAIHAPELADTGDQWREIYSRAVFPIPGVRFYSGVTGESYVPSTAACADAITTQAVGTIDFVQLVENAYRDGVRVFIEHGPRSFCTRQIKDILGGRDYVAVALDTDGTDLRPLTDAVAELLAAGVPLDPDRFFTALPSPPRAAAAARTLEFPAHWPPVRMPALSRPSLENQVEHSGPAHPAGTPGTAALRLSAVTQQQQLTAASHTSLATVRAQAYLRYQRFQQHSLRALVHAATAPQTCTRADVTLSRAQLEYLSTGGKIAGVYGPDFAVLDALPRQLRTPGPPMLLIDNVTELSARPLSQTTGQITSATMVTPQSWYLDPAGRMPIGVMLEAAQAHMLLASWLGIELKADGERRYRVIGAEFAFAGQPPAMGETVSYDMTVDGHAESGGTLLYFFHGTASVAGQPRLHIRAGVGGFFTADELANARGVDWARPEIPEKSLPAPPPSSRGPQYGAGNLRLLPPADRINEGYIRAEQPIAPNDWFFTGHLYDDPCMPGTVLVHGCLELLAQYMAAAGLTHGRESWRFGPAEHERTRIRCGGQVTPASQRVVYEAFITSRTGDTITANVLCTVDGVQALVLENAALRLLPPSSPG